MKLLFYTTLFLGFLLSCTEKAQDKNVKIVSLTENVYSSKKILEKQLRLKLKIESIEDSFISYQYMIDTFILSRLSFNIKSGAYIWNQDSCNPEVMLVDSFYIKMHEKNELIYKFERYNKSGLSDICYFFSRTYGKIGSASYTFGSLQLLNRWGTQDLATDLEKFFLQKDLIYLKNSSINHIVSIQPHENITCSYNQNQLLE